MTAPRVVHAGTTYLITRRCLIRMLLLRPSAVVTEVFAFLLARAAKRTGVKVHAYCVMSNHYHLVVTDPQARLPEFVQYLDSFVARATNALLGRWEQFWGGHSYSAVVLGSAEDIVSKVAYTLANPVAAGLVPAGHLCPGLWSKPDDFGTTLRVHHWVGVRLLPDEGGVAALALRVAGSNGREHPRAGARCLALVQRASHAALQRS